MNEICYALKLPEPAQVDPAAGGCCRSMPQHGAPIDGSAWCTLCHWHLSEHFWTTDPAKLLAGFTAEGDHAPNAFAFELHWAHDPHRPKRYVAGRTTPDDDTTVYADTLTDDLLTVALETTGSAGPSRVAEHIGARRQAVGPALQALAGKGVVTPTGRTPFSLKYVLP